MQNLDYLKTTLQFWKYNSRKDEDSLRRIIAKLYFGDESKTDRVFLCENARTAQYLFFKSLDVEKGKSVMLQAFTCNAVVNPLLWLDLSPKYIDIDGETLNISVDLLSQKIDLTVAGVVLQHTFGKPSSPVKVKELCEKEKIWLLEDCAHALGGQFDGKLLGTFGDAAIISFGLEKVLSTRVGGALIVNNDKLLGSINREFSSWPSMSTYDTFKWLLNPLFWLFLRRLGNSQDRVALILNKLGFLNMGFYKSESRGIMPSQYPRKLSGALAKFVEAEIADLGSNLSHRSNMSKVYFECLNGHPGVDLVEQPDSQSTGFIPFVRFPIILKSKEIRDLLYEKLSSEGIYIGKWYDPVIYPSSTDLDLMHYKAGLCPVAEDISSRILNLPTGKAVSEQYARMVCDRVLGLLTTSE